VFPLTTPILALIIKIWSMLDSAVKIIF